MFISCFLLLCSPRSYGLGKPVKGQSRTIVIPKAAHARVEFGANRLATALQAAGYQVKVVKQDKLAGKQGLIVIGKLGDELLQKATSTYQLGVAKTLAKEGFAINSAKSSNVLV